MALALIAGATAATFSAPAGAQFREFFPLFGGSSGQSNPYNPFASKPQQPQVPLEATRPPLPKKVETQPTSSVFVIGDSFADWLGYGLEETFADTPDVGIVRKIRPYSGLVRYDVRPDSPEWSQAVKELLENEKPNAIVVMLGLNDRLPLRERVPPPPPKGAATAAKGQAPQGQAQQAQTPAPAAAPEMPESESEQSALGGSGQQARPKPGASYEFHTDEWAALYGKRIDAMIAALKGKGVPVLWVGLPALRGIKSTTDMSYLDELYRDHAQKAGIIYVDIWDGFVDDKGQFTLQGPDFEGQTRRLRTFDGVNFTKPGAEKLARYVERELRRVLTTHVVPVALPGPEEPAPGNTRPLIGPVLPLSTTASGEGGELLGAPSRPAPAASSDPAVTRVLTHGDAIAAPPGRADDFSWPRADANATIEPEPVPPPAPVVSAPPATKGAAKAETGKGETGKAEPRRPGGARTQMAPVPAAAPSQPNKPRAALDGAPPRPPLPVGATRD